MGLLSRMCRIQRLPEVEALARGHVQVVLLHAVQQDDALLGLLVQPAPQLTKVSEKRICPCTLARVTAAACWSILRIPGRRQS